MNKQLIIIMILILIVYISRLIINCRKRATYLKAGQKWDGIVKELSRRK
tara:strand:- start:624 stop:770 length:147 start_codon:yes stop_codon:yes gene_type:complete